MDPRTVLGEVVRSARALEDRAGFPAAYVERARAAAAALSPVELTDDDVAGAARELGRAAGADLVLSQAATSWPGRLVARPVGKLVHWHLGFLVPQAGDLGRAAARLGVAVAARLDHVEVRRRARRAALHTEVDALRARVEELEPRP
jgi:hypothetical protein